MKVYCLRFDHMLKGDALVLNSACTDRRTAELLLSDRQANAEACRGEYVALIPRNQYDAEHGQRTRMFGEGF